jgi:menaquinone-dependent protoporphyrinogen IX oxidase
MFFSVYYTASECKIMNISSAAHSVANSIYGTFCAISDLSDEAEQVEALKTVIDAATGIAGMFASSAQSFFNQHSTVSTSRGECSNRMVASCSIYTEIESCLKKVFPGQKKYVLADFQKTYIAFLNRHSAWLTTTACARLAGEIGAVYPEYAEKIKREEEIKSKRIQLEEEIKSLNQQINATSSPSASGCIGGFFLIVGAFMFRSNAEALLNKAKAAGYQPAIINFNNGMNGVGVSPCNNIVEAKEALKAVRKEAFCPKDVWILLNE